MTPEERAASVVAALPMKVISGLHGESVATIDWTSADLLSRIAAAIRSAVEAEREECAKLVEERPIGRSVGAHHVFAELCLLAEDIRARTATEPSKSR